MNPNLSQTPYLLRALWQWCTDAGLSPQIVVLVDKHTKVPMQFVENGRIVLDISAEATNRLEMGDEWITFQARFGARVEELMIPVGNVVAIFAEETNQGMMFEAAPLADSELLTDEWADQLTDEFTDEMTDASSDQAQDSAVVHSIGAQDSKVSKESKAAKVSTASKNQPSTTTQAEAKTPARSPLRVVK